MTASDQIIGMDDMDADSIDLNSVYQDSDVESAIALLDEELVGLAPVKSRVSEIASFISISLIRTS